MVVDLTILPQDDGRRAVDVLIARTGMSRLLTKKIRLYGHLTLDGQHARMIDPVRTGQHLRAVHGAPQNGCRIRTVPGVSVLYRDDWVVVVSKPAGMVTHPTYLHSRDGLTAQLSPDRLHPVNRLDRDTSGLVVLATNGHAHHVLAGQITEKEYWGIVRGVPDPPAGRISAPIARAADSIMERVIDPERGRPSATRYEVLQTLGGGIASLVRFQLETGRTHQIRVHCRHIGHPLLGDDLYALPDAVADAPLPVLPRRQALHAASTTFPHPWTGRVMSFFVGLPEDLRLLIRSLSGPLP